MSVIHTESFIPFPRYAGADDWSTTNKANIDATTANLRRAGYLVYTLSNAGATSSGGWQVRNDPVDASRASLVHSCGNTTFSSNVTAGIRKQVQNQFAPIIGGFSLFIPTEFVKATSTSATVAMRMCASQIGDGGWYTVDIGTTNTKEIFRITHDLLIKWGTDAAQSTKALVSGRMNYIEYQITAGEVRVWVDDVFVLQKSIPLIYEGIGIVFENNNAPTLMIGAAGRWAISNWYTLAADTILPNVRLGPTTRIVGTRPNTDVSTQFVRPAGPVSNAAVAGQDLTDVPNYSLQSTAVGDKDVYSSSTDTSLLGGVLVHAVVTKTLAANLEGTQHTLRPFVRSAEGTEVVDPRGRDFKFANGGNPVFGVRVMKGVAMRPTDGKIFACGSNLSLYATPAAGDGSTWSVVADGATGTNNCIAFRSDGWGVMGRADGMVAVFAPGVDTPTVIVPNANAIGLNVIAVLPNGTFVLAGTNICIRSSTPDVAASWTKNTCGTAAAIYGMAVNSSGKIIVAYNAVGGISTSNDGGANWALSTTTITGVTWKSIACDGTNFIVSAATTSGQQAKSVDGVTWSAMTPRVNNNGSSNAVQNMSFMAADPNTGMFIGVGALSTIMACSNLFDWRLSTLSNIASATFNAACVASNGNWVMVTDGAHAATYTPISVDSVLTPMVGYMPMFNSSTVNPTTGLAWTPAEASASQFGQRVTS